MGSSVRPTNSDLGEINESQRRAIALPAAFDRPYQETSMSM